MRILLYNPADKANHTKVGKELQALPEGDYVITIKKNRPVRSIAANKFFWAVIKIYAVHTGHTENEINEMFRMDRFFKITYNAKGEEKKVTKSTSKLDTKEFSEVINNLLQWGREEFPEVIIPRQEDLTYKQWLEIENSYSRTFSGY